jgi:hypothetical protein
MTADHSRRAASAGEAQLRDQDRIRRDAKTRLREAISSIHREAAERGLTEAELERLLADES